MIKIFAVLLVSFLAITNFATGNPAANAAPPAEPIGEPTKVLPQKKQPTYQEKFTEDFTKGLNHIQNLDPKDFNWEFYKDPRFKRTIQFLTAPKNYESVKLFINKDNLRRMIIGQIIVLLAMMLLKAWVNRGAKGFLSRFFNSLWIFGLHIFVALVVLPRYIYGPAFFDFTSQIAEIFKGG